LRPSGLVAGGIVLAAGLLVCPSAFALNPALDVSQYAHTAWRIRDGFIDGTTQAIAQTPDGYIWIGSDSGLFRFDGIRATRWQPPRDQDLPSTNIINLMAAPDGALWISTAQGLAMWDGRTLVQYRELAGLYIGKALAERDGTVWVAAADPATSRWTLCAIAGRATQCYGRDGGDGVGTYGLFQDRRGNVWVGAADGLWRWKPGPRQFFPIRAEPNGFQGIVEDDDGTLLLSMRGGIYRFADGRVELVSPYPASVQPPQALHFLRDRHGGLWAGTAASGVVHVHDGKVDVFADIDGLSSNRVSKLFEDHEGSVWVVTRDGVDRFRDPAVATVSRPQGLAPIVTSLAAAPDGTIWVGTLAGLHTVRRNDARLFRTAGLPAENVESILYDRQGRLWVSQRNRVGFVRGTEFVPMGDLSSGVVRAIAEDSTGVWFAVLDAGLFRFAPGRREPERTPWSTFAGRGGVTAMVGDAAQQGVWLGFASGSIAYFRDGSIRSSHAASDGLAVGAVRNIRIGGDGSLWVSGDRGLSRIKNGRIGTLTRQDGLPCDAVRWTVEDDARSVWVNTRCGLVQITGTDVDDWFSAAVSTRPPPTVHLGPVLDITEGTRDTGISAYTSEVVKAPDGKLWFRTASGVGALDPGHLPFNALPPPVQIEQITADHRRYDTPHALPPRVRDLQIDYTALSFVAPDKIRFRYWLEGYDASWQEAGTRRQAFYTNLPPRPYRFRVIAANNSGVWNETGATLEFVIPPAYYQTRWFLALSVGAGIALVWTAHRVRVRIIERHQREISALNERLMKAQEQERIRIAGELHDGVMQQMLAVTMMLGTAKRKIADNADAQQSIDKIQQTVIQAGTEIRQLSHGLHPPLLQEAGLPEALRSHCEQFNAASGVAVACEADERARDLSRGAALALFRIAQEALGNAAKHASATHVIVRLTRSDTSVVLTITDDGVGFDRSRLGMSGGLGLVMMRERAGQLNGTFDFDTAPGRGTTIRVVIPFR
jgi:signal transduction histidine kinase/ligand-binding sensor domain-containing protein